MFNFIVKLVIWHLMKLVVVNGNIVMEMKMNYNKNKKNEEGKPSWIKNLKDLLN
ncbi:Uncharacterised protein [Chlamydia trachomatis]|nr:Uncharacterised protein [Chlamydia trachomatis]